MKLKNYLICFFLIPACNVSIVKASSSDILLSMQVTGALIQQTQNLTDTVPPYPIRGVMDDGTIQQGITDRTIKAMASKKTWPILAAGNFSVLPIKAGEFSSYPAGSALFSGYTSLASKFDSMIASFTTSPEYVAFFRKVHINVLNELYHHLMSVYVNFNLQHAGITQSITTGVLQVNIPAFLQDEQTYATNQKTLIINHLINLVESQFNGAIRSYVPNLPQIYASFMGKVLIHNDYSIDLSRFLDKEIEAATDFSTAKQAYLKGLAQYLDFFQTFTSYLHQPHPKNRQHFTAFVDIAEQINQYLYADADPSADKAAIAVAKMNPPMFTFNYDDMRAIKMIPYLAKNLPAQSAKIMWPEQIVQAANEGLCEVGASSKHPLAYFRTINGTVVQNTTEDTTIPLYICVRSGQNLFEERLLVEPDWLGSWDGIVKIMRACFGDFSALIGLDILDPCMETLIQQVMVVKGGGDPNTIPSRADACSTLMNLWKTSPVATQVTSTTVIPTIPGISNLPLLKSTTGLSSNNLPPPQLPALSATALHQEGG